MLECSGLVRRFGDRVAVDDVSLHIAAGETYGLLGPNGAGKTTTISMICGLVRPDAGSVRVSEDPMGVGRCQAKGHVGLVPQEVALYPDLTGRENLRFLGRLHRMDRARLRRRVDEVLELVGLADRADDRVEEYSGGMQRRANIAAGLLHEPELLVLDEPTVGVDPQSRAAIMAALDTLRAGGLAVLYTTHYMEEAERLCDRVGIIDEGRLVAEGTKAELVARIGEHPVVRLSVAGPPPGAVSVAGDDGAAAAVARVPGVLRVSSSLGGGPAGAAGRAVGGGGRVVEVAVEDAGRALAPVVEAAERHGLEVTRVDVAEPDLESVFLHLTGKALRD